MNYGKDGVRRRQMMPRRRGHRGLPAACPIAQAYQMQEPQMWNQKSQGQGFQNIPRSWSQSEAKRIKRMGECPLILQRPALPGPSRKPQEMHVSQSANRLTPRKLQSMDHTLVHHRMTSKLPKARATTKRSKSRSLRRSACHSKGTP